ncbi:MAG: DNA-binding protein [Hymenobacter sp.]|nr:MAG: DNA-binding protein [Hymenobacter sp.]
MATLILSGVEYAQFFDDLRAVIRHEINQAISPMPAISEGGGTELAQEVTGLSQSRIYALVSVGGIPHFKRGNKLYFTRADLLDWVEHYRRSADLHNTDS